METATLLFNLQKRSFPDGDYLVDNTGKKVKKFICYNLDGDEVWRDLSYYHHQNQWGQTLRYDSKLDNYYVV